MAVRASRRVIDLDPDDPESWVASARVAQLVEPGSRSSVITAVRRALAIDSTSVESSESWFELGLAWQELLRDSAAEAAWRRAITLDPGNTQALGFLALHFHWIGQPDLGVAYADSAVALDPVFVVAREAAWQLAFDRGRIDEAEQQVAALERSASGLFQEIAVAGRVRVQLERGDTADARVTLARAVQAVDVEAPTKHQAIYIGGALAALGAELCA